MLGIVVTMYGNSNDVGGVFTLTRACSEESTATLKKCHDLNDDEFQLMMKSMPVRRLYSFNRVESS